MLANNVCAIVVTFHPNDDIVSNLAALRPQVQQLLVVDNGSAAALLEILRRASKALSFELIENGENLGIATALNIGIRRATTPWILLFDQDSCVTPDFTQNMIRCFKCSRWGDRLALLVPRYQDKRFGSVIPPDRLAFGSLAVAMTSGSLVRRETFQTHGLFEDDLFIDGVDHEYSLRLRAANLMLDECEEAVLLHSPGTPTFYRWMGWSFQTANYSPIRRYYQERNKLWLCKRYFLKFPHYCAGRILVTFTDLLKIILCEQGKVRKVRFFLRGVVDGMLGRTGRFDPPSA